MFRCPTVATVRLLWKDQGGTFTLVLYIDTGVWQAVEAAPPCNWMMEAANPCQWMMEAGTHWGCADGTRADLSEQLQMDLLYIR